MKSIKTKQKLYLSQFVNGNSEQKQFYKKYANKLTKVKFAAKKLYYQDKLETSKNNTAEVWRIIKSLLSSSRSDASLPQTLRHNKSITLLLQTQLLLRTILMITLVILEKY